MIQLVQSSGLKKLCKGAVHAQVSVMARLAAEGWLFEG
jgi:hypothetical protein